MILLPLLEALLRRWHWLGTAGVLLGGLGTWFGLGHFQSHYEAVAQLIRYESPNASEVFRPQQIMPQTVADVLKSPQMLQRAAALARPPLTPRRLSASLKIAPQFNSDMVLVALEANQPQRALDLANLYAQEAVRYTQELQAHEAGEVGQFLASELSGVEKELHALYQQLGVNSPAVGTNASVQAGLNRVLHDRLAAQLATAQEDLANLLLQFKPTYPAVQEKQALIDGLEKQLMALRSTPAITGLAGTNPVAQTANSVIPAAPILPSAPERSGTRLSEREVIIAKLQVLENTRLSLLARQQAARLFQDHPPGYFHLIAPATPESLLVKGRTFKVAAFALFAALAGVLAVASALLLAEFADPHLRTKADVKRVTGLPLLASLPDLDSMTPSAQTNWAFRTWTALQGHLSASPNHGLVCGITSSHPGEGRSVWVNLLAQAANDRGFRVLTIATRPTALQMDSLPQIEPGSESPNPQETPKMEGRSALMNAKVLASPAEVTEKLVGPDPQPRVHIPIPGWVWNLERRKQWQAALNHWQQIDNIVILVELPPASVPEAVLLAENLPQLLWLTDSQVALAGETRQQLQTLHYARCNLVGALLNRAPAQKLQQCLPRWLSVLALGLAWPALVAHAAEPRIGWSQAQDTDWVRNLRVSHTAEAGHEIVLAVDYSRTPARGRSAYLVPVIARRGHSINAAHFETKPVLLSALVGTAYLRVTYHAQPPDYPAQFTTDRVLIKMLDGTNGAPLAVCPFHRVLTWSDTVVEPAAITVAKAQPPARSRADSEATDMPLSLADPPNLAARSAMAAAPGEGDILESTPASGAPPRDSNFTFSVVGPQQRAPWQEHLTLGPGDVLNLALFGHLELSRTNVIGPDGRLTYLEAHDVMASGLTLEELRHKLDEELGKYRYAPRTIVTPAEFHSKKYYLLGRISQRGVFTLDRPITVIEAVARAHGLETGLGEQRVVELADLSRSFLARHGNRMSVDFEKLFLQGDLSQNIPLEPGDYLYFPTADLNEVYVLGAVNSPGRLTYNMGLTALGAIAGRGGFAERAWKGKVLVVRGSLNHPQTFALNAGAALAARAPDFELQPRDIVYVNTRPWARAEQLLDAAAQAFTEAAVIVWTGGHVGTFVP